MSSYRCLCTCTTPIPMAHLSADVPTIFFNDFLYIYISATPILAKEVAQGIISDTYSNHRGIYLKKKKLCLSNKHLVIFWVISIGHAYNLCFKLLNMTACSFFFFFFFFLYEGFNSCQHVSLIHDRHTCYFWFKTDISNIPNIICV